ncbi:hypothetical protein HDU93_004896 [Gonapodya sp. JEL0774]|nr:hypothetical protein HDU93_004896 [Gonapodya sp. JEL0774]
MKQVEKFRDIGARGFSGKEADVWALGMILFTMTHSRLPADHDKIVAKIDPSSAGSYPGTGIGQPGTLLQNLLGQLLLINHRKRITAEAALQHPFFAASSADTQ